MDIETYEVGETTTDLQEDVSSEQIELIKKLGLDGQDGLISGDDEDAIVCHYRLMTEEEFRVYKTLCPEETNVKSFSDHVIPLRVLQVIAHAKELEDVVGELRIWTKKSSLIDDPVLVGVKSSASWNRKIFLLARWGSELKPFDELRVLAGEILKRNWLAKLHQAKAEANQIIASIENASNEAAVDILKPDMPTWNFK